VVTARTAEQIEQTASEIRAKGRKAIAVPSMQGSGPVDMVAKKALEEYGRIDIWVNNVVPRLTG
jgi:NADP-dependent 3-hydroxy acid dehydrogenase YdfG